jgi:hypothetical protein
MPDLLREGGLSDRFNPQERRRFRANDPAAGVAPAKATL